MTRDHSSPHQVSRQSSSSSSSFLNIGPVCRQANGKDVDADRQSRTSHNTLRGAPVEDHVHTGGVEDLLHGLAHALVLCTASRRSAADQQQGSPKLPTNPHVHAHAVAWLCHHCGSPHSWQHAQHSPRATRQHMHMQWVGFAIIMAACTAGSTPSFSSRATQQDMLMQSVGFAIAVAHRTAGSTPSFSSRATPQHMHMRMRMRVRVLMQ